MLPRSRQKKTVVRSRFLCLEPLEDRQLLSLTFLHWLAHQQTADRPALLEENTSHWLTISWESQEILWRSADAVAASLPIIQEADPLQPSERPNPLLGERGAFLSNHPILGIKGNLASSASPRPTLVEKPDIEVRPTPSSTHPQPINREPLLGARDVLPGSAHRPELGDFRERLGRRGHEIVPPFAWRKPTLDSRVAAIPSAGLPKGAVDPGSDMRESAKTTVPGQLPAPNGVTFAQEGTVLLGVKREVVSGATPSYFGKGGGNETPGAGEDGTLQSADVWSGMAVLDTAALDAVLEQLVASLDEAGRTLANAFIDSASLPLLVGTLATGLALEITRRQRRKQGLQFALAGLDADPTFTWMPGLPGSFSITDE